MRFFISRLCMKRKLARCCKKAGFHISFKSCFSVFSRIGGRENDFYIETADGVYSVKLVGFVFKKKALCFIDDTHYSIKAYGGMRFLANVAFDGPYVIKKKSKCDFEAHLPFDANNVKCIYLMCPDPWIKVSVIEGNGMREIADGDACSDACFYTLEGFLKEIYPHIT